MTTPTARSAPVSSHGRQLGLERDHRQADEHEAERVTDAPPGAEAGGPAGVAVVGGDERGDRHQVVGVRGVAEAEDERDRQRDEQRRALEQPGQPRVRALERAEEVVDAHRAAATAA